MAEKYSLFFNPTSEYRGKPFWCWNGTLEKEELLRQISIMKDMGMGGYFCHSRTGLKTKYLGEEWFDLVNACAEKGSQIHMETWLYDEDRWPSGTAGGMITADPAFRLKYIRLTIIDGKEFTFDPNALAIFSVRLDGFSFDNKERIFTDGNYNGKTILKFSVEEMEQESFYNGNTYVDTMNKSATIAFIQKTHEQYLGHCGEHFNCNIKGIFTDEPHRGAVMCGFSLHNPQPDFLTPYTGDLIPYIKKQFGYDLTNYLPELFLWKDGNKYNKIKWEYMESLQQLFLDNYFIPINDWCNRHNILLTGHVLHEDNLTSQASMIGSVARAYEYMGIPGVDVLSEFNYNFNIVKQLQSVCRQLGKKHMLSELYGCTGWQMDFESHKHVGDWQALFGIDLRCHHLYWYTMQGEAKRDYPASIGHQSAWYREYKYIEEYFSRIHVHMSEGEPLSKLLVITPVESLWSMIYPGWNHCFATYDDDIKKLETDYAETFKRLVEARIEFDYGDEDHIKRYGTVEIMGNTPVLKVGHMCYKEVLLSGLITMRRSTFDLLKEFADCGGHIVIAGAYPQMIDVQKTEEPKCLTGIAVAVDDIISALNTKSLISVIYSTGEPITDIYAQAVKVNNEYRVMLLNINRAQKIKDAKICIPLKGYCEKWDARNGTVSLLCSGDDIQFIADFEPGEEFLLTITSADNGYRKVEKPAFTETILLNHDFDYELLEDNVCVLDFVDYRIDDSEWILGKEILRADREIRNAFELPLRGGEMLQPWFSEQQTFEKKCRLELQYSFCADQIPDGLKLVIENPEAFQININGKPVNNKTNEYWVDKCFVVYEIDTGYINEGQNYVTLSCDFSEEINLEAMYLLGKFGVRLEGRTTILTELPGKLHVGDVVAQGLPFYGAGIRYILKNIDPNLKNQRVFLDTEGFEAAVIKVSQNNVEKIIAAKPYALEITEYIYSGKEIYVDFILTRRNTFGPLHFKPLISPGGYGPFTYTLDGEEWFLEDGYSLLPQGMVNPLKLLVSKL